MALWRAAAACIAVGAGWIAQTSAAAGISVYRCSFSAMPPIFITIYDDGTPTRIGTVTGIGDKAIHYPDLATGALVIVELNGVGLPITLTTINRDGSAVHSRHVLSVPEGWKTPTQQVGRCDRQGKRCGADRG